jgi:hypothetical protein
MKRVLLVVAKLTEEEWKTEKEWLKGMKFLLQLHQKRVPNISICQNPSMVIPPAVTFFSPPPLKLG